MGAPSRSYGGKGSSSRSTSARAGLYTSKASASISTPKPSKRRNSMSDSMTEIFNELTKISELKAEVDDAEAAYVSAQEALNVAVDKFYDKIEKHPSKDSLKDLLTGILSGEEKDMDDFER